MKQLLIFINLIAFTNIRAEFDETILTKPLKDSNQLNLSSIVCRTRPHLRWDVCFSKINENTEVMTSFKFRNYGPNKIVQFPGNGVSRSFEFQFEDFARSDLNLLVWDSPDEVESHGHLKMIMFFPRNYLWSINYESNNQIDVVNVTTPNGEQIVFDGKSKEIISGVLEENPIQQDSKGNALEPSFNYTGKGVMLWAHRLNDYPVGVNNNYSKKNQLAYIFKKNQKLCTVKASDLWYTDPTKSGNVFFNKKYVSDIEFNKYVEAKCGFTIY